MRAFVALELPDEVIDALLRVQSRLPVGRPVVRDNLHLTLAFLDDQRDNTLEDFHDELSGLRWPQFGVVLTGLGAFGGDRPRQVFLDVAENPALTGLHNRTVAAARRAGIVLQRRRYHPHVTLARLRPGADSAGRLQAFFAAEAGVVLPRFEARSFALFRSDLRPGGAVHDVLARYELAQG
ncbi:RNA 2',3'-cyclic phosphodiesterase [Sedimentitalea nanhaiensis]|uniref:RNA 2',3'-cyclic phosphodiesterase n=1 Tax=Sedimentitalea nanhaiensis TaxID=999627 RepID=A0A1I6YXC2_9RHOB|nr:RNA 2',3'-cyclic phosphodiesterase [Sedimentitalea nanhaiensis]SFT55092.1 2'-5' RNA ligase [Sedimentitalea nanhaiensis]